MLIEKHHPLPSSLLVVELMIRAAAHQTQPTQTSPPPWSSLNFGKVSGRHNDNRRPEEYRLEAVCCLYGNVSYAALFIIIAL